MQSIHNNTIVYTNTYISNTSYIYGCSILIGINTLYKSYEIYLYLEIFWCVVVLLVYIYDVKINKWNDFCNINYVFTTEYSI